MTQRNAGPRCGPCIRGDHRSHNNQGRAWSGHPADFDAYDCKTLVDVTRRWQCMCRAGWPEAPYGQPFVPQNPRLALQLVLQDLAERWPLEAHEAAAYVQAALLPAIRAAHAHPPPEVILGLTEEEALAVAHVLDGGLEPGSLEVAREVAVQLREEVRARREEAD